MGQLFAKKRRGDYSRDDECDGRGQVVASNYLEAGDGEDIDRTRRAPSADFACQAAVLTCFPAGGTSCLIAGKDTEVREYNYADGEVLNIWKGHSRDVTKVVWCATSSCAFSASRDTSAKMWRRGLAQPICTFNNHDLAVTGLAVDPGSGSSASRLCTGSRDNKICLWDVESGQVVSENKTAQNLVTHICWKDGLLAQTGEDKQLRLWDVRNLQLARTFARKQQILLSCDVAAPYAITSSHGINGTGCEVTLWDTRGTSSLPVHEFRGHTESVASCRFLPKLHGRSSLIASAGSDRYIRIWDYNSLVPVSELQTTGTGPLTDIAVNQGDSRLCISTFERGLIVLSSSEINGRLCIDY